MVGCDPEVFVCQDGKFISGHGMVNGTKENPLIVPKGAVQVDGTALEFNIDPAETRIEFVGNVIQVFNILQEMIGRDRVLTPVPVVDYSPEYFRSIPEKSRELGCNPDYNAWTGDINEPPNANVTFRTGSGHIHVGWTEGADTTDPDHLSKCSQLVQQLDYFLGMPSLLWDNDNRRRKLYGLAGAFRPKSYGVEYRVLSNAWLKSEELIGWVYDSTMIAVRNLMNGNFLPKQFGNTARNVINKNQSDFFDRYGDMGIPMPPVMIGDILGAH